MATLCLWQPAVGRRPIDRPSFRQRRLLFPMRKVPCLGRNRRCLLRQPLPVTIETWWPHTKARHRPGSRIDRPRTSNRSPGRCLATSPGMYPRRKGGRALAPRQRRQDMTTSSKPRLTRYLWGRMSSPKLRSGKPWPRSHKNPPPSSPPFNNAYLLSPELRR